MNFKDLLSFEKMITPKIMKIYFIVVAIAIALSTVIGFFGALIAGGIGVLVAFAVLITGAISLVVFRVFCEIIILFFAMHEELVQMRKKLAGDSVQEAPASVEQSTAPVQSPEQPQAL